uniref:Uncharacterized protein n=1 Tax=Acrobeloides nanus TaxID=290746 RepID=A0A914DCJ5_9BILA
MISILVIVIAFVYNTNDCDYDGYTGSYDGDCDNGDDSTISVGAQIACIVIGLLYFALFIIRMISQALQLKIRNYWIYILSKKNASNATTAPSPPPYQPNVEANPPGFSPGQVYSVSNQVPNQSVGSSLQIPRAQTPAHFQQNLGNSPNKSSTYPTKNLDSDDAWT